MRCAARLGGALAYRARAGEQADDQLKVTQDSQRRGRRLVTVAGPELPSGLAPPSAIRQILDVLIGNALWHGEGTVTIAAHEADGGVAIKVSDEGPGLAAEEPDELLAGSAERADGHGRGLPLARSLAAATGGSLVVPRAGPRPVFSLLLPATAGDRPAPA